MKFPEPPTPDWYESDENGEMQLQHNGDWTTREHYDNLRIAYDEVRARLDEIGKLAMEL